MKKKTILQCLLVSSLLIGASACSNEDVTNRKINEVKPKTVEIPKNEEVKTDVRESVWNQLNKSDKDLIRGSWKEAKVTILTLKPGMGKISKGEYLGKEVYIVDFPMNESINSILVYASIENHEIIGRGYSD